jgi:hypothetical protein
MDERAKNRIELGLLWSAPLFVVGYLISIGFLGHYLPPPNMVAMTPEQLISEYYDKYQNQISYGMVGCSTVGVLYLPWSCLLASKLRDENGNLGVFSFMELSGGILTTWVVAFCPAIWAACAVFANSVDPSVIKFMHAIAWYFYDITYWVTVIQIAGFALYVLSNKKQTIFPRWTGFYAILECLIMVPLTLIPFVSKGPFTVGGLINWWIGLTTWLVWFLVCSYFMLQSILGQKETVGAVGLMVTKRS